MKNHEIEDTLAFINENTDLNLARNLLCTLDTRHPGIVKAFLATQSRPEEVRNPFERGIRKASEFSDDIPPIQPLWFGLYPGALIYLCGETGAGKSSLLYNILILAARNETLWDVPFGSKRPLKVLYLDPENSGDFDTEVPGLCEQKVKRIGQGKPESLHFHDGQSVNLSQPEQMEILERFVATGQYDILVLDPILNLFRTNDENDNAEAGKQFTELKALAKRTGCCVIAVHHTGRDNTSNFGRGASARLSAADVGLMLRRKNEGVDINDDYKAGENVTPTTDFVRLQIVKNRLEPGKFSLYLRMAGNDRFERISYEEWKIGTKSEREATEAVLPSKSETAKEAVLLLLSDGTPRKTGDIVDALKTQGIGNNSVRVALRELKGTKISEGKQGRETFYQMIDDDARFAKEKGHHHQSWSPQTLLISDPYGEDAEEESRNHNLDAFSE